MNIMKKYINKHVIQHTHTGALEPVHTLLSRYLLAMPILRNHNSQSPECNEHQLTSMPGKPCLNFVFDKLEETLEMEQPHNATVFAQGINL